MTKRKDWVKRIAIILAIVFFIMWVVNILNNFTEIQTFDKCETNIKELHTQWQYAYNTLNNCYENNMPSCTVNIPTLK